MKYSPLYPAMMAALSLLNTNVQAFENNNNTLDEEAIERIVVTASGFINSTLEAPASVTIISREQIAQTADPSLTNLLRTAAGVSLSGRGVGGRNVIQLRGMDSKHSLILINGRRISATDDVIGHSDLQYDWLPVDSIERIEVVRGPLSALYGSEAIGGVVNIITRGIGDSWRGALNTNLHLPEDGKGGEGWGAGINVAGPLAKNLGLSLSVSQRRKEDRALISQPELTDLEGKALLSLNTSLYWQASEQHRFEFFYNQTAEERWQWTTNRGMPPIHDSRYDLTRQHYGASWLPEFGQWQGQLTYYQSRIDIEHSASHNIPAFTPQYLRDQMIDGRLQRALGDNHQLTLGAEWRQEELIHPAFLKGKDSATQKALLIQDQWQLLPAVTLTLGSRLDQHQYFGSELSPRAYLVWQLADQIALKTGYGHGFRAPSLKQASPEYRFTGQHSFIVNGDLQPESGDNLELGIYLERGNFLASSMLFYNKVADLIGTQCIENCSARFGRVNTYVNIERATIKGMELELEWRPIAPLRLKTAYTFLDTKDNSSELHLPGRPEHRVNSQLEWQLVKDKWYVSLNHDYTGKQWQRSANSENQMSAYHLLNASLRWQQQQHQISLSVTNLNKVDLNNKEGSFGYNEPGRSYHLRWQYRFKE